MNPSSTKIGQEINEPPTRDGYTRSQGRQESVLAAGFIATVYRSQRENLLDQHRRCGDELGVIGGTGDHIPSPPALVEDPRIRMLGQVCPERVPGQQEIVG